MGIGPVVAVPKVLKQADLKMGDIGLIELNEAFASQALRDEAGLRTPAQCQRRRHRAGSPLGCTGAKLTTSLLYEMHRRGAYGIVTMCIGGGMGAAGIFERLN